MMRSFPDSFRQYQQEIPLAVITLLRNCPSEHANLRKELLIATRHILITDFRNGFIPYIDTLLEESVLIGNGRTCWDTLR
jgi:transformation/transcription domain-associated protein